jgi:hypothetical protein
MAIHGKTEIRCVVFPYTELAKFGNQSSFTKLNKNLIMPRPMCMFSNLNVAAKKLAFCFAHTHTLPAPCYYNDRSQILCGKETNYWKTKHWEFIHLEEPTLKKKD